ncbi:uncharacterized protein LOC126672176 [Mercurialis annua]|uniref:uncharacterized protein LOC126672176 n=1 Tax=Mercurialis annua TaxID=3986 RepID=UPI002160FB15|nr:uncharacterized protein LOC126672176 [Mercurialis annua]
MGKFYLGSDSDVELFCFHLWHIWKSRNTLVFKHLTTTVSEVISLSISACLKYQEVQLQTTPIGPKDCLTQHILSDQNSPYVFPSYAQSTIILRYDAVVDKLRKFGVIAVIAYDYQLTVVGRFSAVFRHIWDPGILELLALREAMNWANSKCWKDVGFEGDALQVSATVNSGICSNVGWQNICEDIWHLRQAFRTSTFRYIPRLQNWDAHDWAQTVKHSV